MPLLYFGVAAAAAVAVAVSTQPIKFRSIDRSTTNQSNHKRSIIFLSPKRKQFVYGFLVLCYTFSSLFLQNLFCLLRLWFAFDPTAVCREEESGAMRWLMTLHPLKFFLPTRCGHLHEMAIDTLSTCVWGVNASPPQRHDLLWLLPCGMSTHHAGASCATSESTQTSCQSDKRNLETKK